MLRIVSSIVLRYGESDISPFYLPTPPPKPKLPTPNPRETPTYISISISISIFHDGRDRKGERGGVGRGDMFMIYEYGCKGVGVEERERCE